MRHETRPIIYTNHAKERMIERKITKTEVEAVIRTGAREVQGIGHWLAYGTINGRYVAAAYVEKMNGEIEVLLVKTVMD